jgi:hypothetical protein
LTFNGVHDIIFEKIELLIFLVMTPYSGVERYLYFGKNSCLRLQCNLFLWNVGKYLHDTLYHIPEENRRREKINLQNLEEHFFNYKHLL